MTFNYADIMSSIWSATTMNDYSYKIVHPIWVHSIIRLKQFKNISITTNFKIQIIIKINNYRIK